MINLMLISRNSCGRRVLEGILFCYMAVLNTFTGTLPQLTPTHTLAVMCKKHIYTYIHTYTHTHTHTHYYCYYYCIDRRVCKGHISISEDLLHNSSLYFYKACLLSM